MVSSHQKRDVAGMFDDIAGSYDLLNHLLSGNIDRRWRRRAIAFLRQDPPSRILDVATGTCDLALEAMSLNPEQIVGVDISEKMLEIGRRKVTKAGLDGIIELKVADAEELPFETNSFDAVMVAFGVRNFSNPVKGLSEMLRVLRPGGRLVVLEFTLPSNSLIRIIYRWYFHRLLPSVGRLISKNHRAYRYLPESVDAFDKGEAFLQLLDKAGFTEKAHKKLTFGICGLYTANKSESR